MRIKIRSDIQGQETSIMLFFWSFTLIIRRITAVLMKVFGLMDYVEVLNGFVWAVLVLFTFNVFKKRIKYMDVLFISFIIIFFYIAQWIWPKNDMISEQRIAVLITIIPSYLLGRTLKTNNGCLETMHIISMITIGLNAVVYFAYYLRGGGRGLVDDNLAFSYALLPHVLLLVYYCFNHRKTVNIIVAFASVLLMLMQGTRAPLLLLSIFVIWMFLYKNNIRKNLIYMIVGGTALSVFIGADLYVGVVRWMRLFFDRFGIGTRILDMILQPGQLSSSFWRDYIRSIIINSIKKEKQIGLGPFGDRIVLREFSTNENGLAYSHNIVLELLCDYGVLIGIALIVTLIVLIMRSYRRSRGNDDNVVLVVLILSTIGKLLFSGSYLSEPIFFVMIGYTVSLANARIEVRDNEKGVDSMWDVLSVK